jgi:hypothetical protein
MSDWERSAIAHHEDETRRHVFVTPRDAESWKDERFCAVCGKYMTDDVHIRFASSPPHHPQEPQE